MRNIKIILEYDGAAFFGFQRQPERPTVQEALEKALSKLFNRKIKIRSASGRTDAGVHAECQVVNFKTQSRMPVEKIQKGLNGLLPKQIAVKEIGESAPDFHARYNAKSKVYEYRIWNDSVRSPLQANRTFHVREPLDLSKMRRAAGFLTGRRDFRSFCGTGGVPLTPPAGEARPSGGLPSPRRGEGKGEGNVKNTVRTVKRFELKREGSLIRILIEADGFLHHMVRNLAGTLVEAGRGKISPEDVKSILAARDRRAAGPSVPARALTLVKVNY